MIGFFSFIFLLLSAMSDTHQDTHSDIIPTTQQTSTNSNPSEKFDKEAFEKNKVNGQANYTQDDGWKVRQQTSSSSNLYIVEIHSPSWAWEIRKQYYMDTLALEREWNILHNNNLVGEWKLYDKEGNVTVKNYDADYPYSLEQLDAQLHSMGIYVMWKGLPWEHPNTDNAYLNRDPNEWKPIYTVSYPFEETPWKIHVLIIDGTSGEIIGKEVGERHK